jgi:hypothetical protein
VTASVDLDELAEAFADASRELEYSVDRETGEVILVSETLGFIEAGEQRFEMSLQPGRYLRLPVATVDDFVADLESFVDGMTDQRLATRLEEALEESDPARAVRHTLAKHEDIANAFAAYRAIRFRRRAARWAEEHALTTV